MKHIVLYTIVFFLAILPEAAAQKPVIDLLPSDHRLIHQEVANDTGYVGDSLGPVVPVKMNEPDSTEIMEKESRKSRRRHGTLPDSVVSTRLRLPRVFILILTALKQ